MGKLRDEIINDPLGRGYAGKTAAEIYTSIYATADRTISIEVSAIEILDVLSFDSYKAWSTTTDESAKAAWKLLELAILSNLRIDVVNGRTYKTILGKARNAAPAAVINLPEKQNAEAKCTRVVTRAVELGLPQRDVVDIQRIKDGEDV